MGGYPGFAAEDNVAGLLRCAVLLVQPAQNPGSLKSEETRSENFRAGQLDALASLVLFQKYLATAFQ